MKIDVKDIEKLIALMEKSTLTEIEIQEKEGASIRLSRQADTSHSFPTPSPHYVLPPTPSSPPSIPAGETSSSPNEAKKIEGHTMKAPMVGTIYLTPSPDAPAFVKVGQKITAGEPVCIIEAMKMMNRIEADKSGTVAAILVESGKPVEFDQPLLIIE